MQRHQGDYKNDKMVKVYNVNWAKTEEKPIAYTVKHCMTTTALYACKRGLQKLQQLTLHVQLIH